MEVVSSQSKMSGLEALTSRVSQLLSLALQEVLEAVTETVVQYQETVVQYQENAARTQREKLSLRRRLQELQEHISTRDTDPQHCAAPSAEENSECDFLFTNLKQEAAEERGEESHDTVGAESRGTAQQEVESYSDEQQGTESGGAVGLQSHCVGQRAAESHLTGCTSDCVGGDTRGPSDTGATQPIRLPLIKEEAEQTDCCMLLRELPVSHLESTWGFSPHEARGPLGGGPHRPFACGSFSSSRAPYSRGRSFTEPGGSGPHTCTLCSKTFSRVGNLRIHQRCHTGEKPYSCLQCGRGFSQAGDLKKHRRVHTGEKPYNCSHCGKSFSRGENLKRHQKIHLGRYGLQVR